MAARSSCPAPSLLHACRRAPRGYRSPALRAASDDDFVTGVLAKLFGRAAVDDPAPLGLARMTVEEWPDQWPANVDEDATLLSDDVGEIAFLRPLLKQTQLERLPLALAYDADAHGWSEDAFHRRLDGQGAALLVLETEAGTLCGGYNSKGWLVRLAAP